ncbi:MAG: DeoR/GlpR family DNA-binding transcription regulator [Treponema sp.]|nr:DeoR/GlpR family DNA-binding transcription regulator [Treponema sp.]
MEKINNRREKIVSFLKSTPMLSIKALSEMLQVSTMTIRRDLELLAEQNIVQIYHGGAIYNPHFLEKAASPNDYYLQQQTLVHKNEKMLIAGKAAELLLPQETIMLDSGTTIFYFAQILPENQNLTIISWSLNIIEELIRKPQNNILIQGGVYHSETQMFENNQGIDIIKNSRASKAFISARGLHSNLGVTCPYHYEVETKRAAIKYSIESVLLIDSSKFGKVCSAHLADINEFHTIITDSGIPAEYEEHIKNAGINLIIAA